MQRLRHPLFNPVDDYGMVDVGSVQRLSARGWILATALWAVLLPTAPPTDRIGAAGWAVAAILGAISCSVAWAHHTRTATIGAGRLLATNYFGLVQLGVLQWLAGGGFGPYSIVVILPTISVAAVHSAPRVVGWMLAVLLMLAVGLALDQPNAGMIDEAISLLLVSAAVAVVVLGIMSFVRSQRAGLRADGQQAREDGQQARKEVDRLGRVDQQRTRDVFAAGHDLRTPLTSILSYLELFLEGDAGELDDAEQREYVEVVHRNSLKLQGLVEDLLTVSGRAPAEQLRLDLRPLDLGAALEHVCTQLRPTAERGGTVLRLEVPAGLGVVGDGPRLDRVFTNLVENAVKYSRPDGVVTTRAFELPGWVVVEVADDGVGIPADELAHVTEHFFRASTARTVPGTGTGLAIVKQLVERHGGSLEIESEVGVGSTFRLRLPVDPQSGRATATGGPVGSAPRSGSA